MNLKDIQNLIKFVARSGANEVKLEMDDLKITIRTGTEGRKQSIANLEQVSMQAQPVAPATPQVEAPAAETSTSGVDESRYITVKSPIIGTFYRKPSPDKPVFKSVGDKVSEGDVLCIIEAMKLFNEIESEVSGTIVKVLVEDASPVEFDQPLFLVDPS